MATKRRGLGGIDALIPPGPDESTHTEPTPPAVVDNVDEPAENTAIGDPDPGPGDELAVNRTPVGQRPTRAQPRTVRRPAEAGTGAKEKFGGYIPYDLADAIRDVIYRVPGLRIGDFLAEASRREIHRLEKIHNGGQPFTPRPAGESLPTGRPIR